MIFSSFATTAVEIAPVENSNALAKSLRPGAEAAARGEYIVQFVRRVPCNAQVATEHN